MNIFNGLVNRFSSKTFSKAHSHHVKMQVSQITDQLFIGTNACCETHYNQELIYKGVLNDLSLEGESVDKPFGVATYLWLPVPDHQAPSFDLVDIGLSYIDRVIAQHGRIFIHCTNGHGRAPTMGIAWLVHQGMSLDEAMDFVTQKRPEVHLESAQKTFLESFAENYKKT